MPKIRVEFDCDIPAQATAEQIHEWLKFELVGGAISEQNPLSEFDVIADYLSLDWEHQL